MLGAHQLGHPESIVGGAPQNRQICSNVKLEINIGKLPSVDHQNLFVKLLCLQCVSS